MKRTLAAMMIVLGSGALALVCVEAWASLADRPGLWVGLGLSAATSGLGVFLIRQPEKPWTYRQEALHRLYLQSRGFR